MFYEMKKVITVSLLEPWKVPLKIKGEKIDNIMKKVLLYLKEEGDYPIITFGLILYSFIL